MSLGDFDLREPSIDVHVAALDAADARWAVESRDIALSDEMIAGSFASREAIMSGGMVTVPGCGDYEGWRLSGYADKGPRDGYHLTAPPKDGDRIGSVVGFVVLGRDGLWTACHDGFNHRPGTALGCTGTRTKHPSAEAAYRDVVVRHARHQARYAR